MDTDRRGLKQPRTPRKQPSAAGRQPEREALNHGTMRMDHHRGKGVDGPGQWTEARRKTRSYAETHSVLDRYHLDTGALGDPSEWMTRPHREDMIAEHRGPNQQDWEC